MLQRFDCQFGLRDLWTATYRSNANHCTVARSLPGFEKEQLRVIPTFRGREALYLVLKLIGLPPRSKVGVPLFTCSVVARMTRAAGMVPVFIDEDPESYGTNLTDLERKAGRLDALVMVHTFGYPQDIDTVKQILSGKPIIGDCAHAVGSSYKGRALGATLQSSIFSFGLRKPLSMGGGGCVTTFDNDLADRIEREIQASRPETKRETAARLLRCLLYATFFHKKIYSVVSYTSCFKNRNGGAPTSFGKTASAEKISPVLHMGLPERNLMEHRIQQWRDSRRWVSDFWDAIRVNTSPRWHIPEEPIWGEWNHFLLPLRMDSAADCEEVLQRFRKRGVGAARVYPNCIVEAVPNGYTGDCPIAERLSQTTFILPAYPRMSARDRDLTIETLREMSRR